jgi:hypothetical protein
MLLQELELQQCLSKPLQIQSLLNAKTQLTAKAQYIRSKYHKVKMAPFSVILTRLRKQQASR